MIYKSLLSQAGNDSVGKMQKDDITPPICWNQIKDALAGRWEKNCLQGFQHGWTRIKL